MSKQLGLLLVREKVISRTQLDETTTAAAQNGKNLVFQLLDQRLVDEGVLSVFISEKMGFPLADRPLLSSLRPEIVQNLARDLAEEFSAIPVEVPDAKTIHLAMIDPTDTAAVEELGFFTGKRIKPLVGSRQIINLALKQYYNIDRGARGVSGNGDTAPPLAEMRPPIAPARIEEPPPRSVFTRDMSESAFKRDAFSAPPANEEVTEKFVMPTHTPAVESVTSLRSPLGESAFSKAQTKATSTPPDPLDSMSVLSSVIALEHTTPATFSSPAVVTPSPHKFPSSALPLDVLHRETLTNLDSVEDKTQVAELFLGFASNILRRVALFTIKKNVLLGWEARGEDFTQRNLKGIMIPLNSPSIFQRVKETKVYYLGPVPRSTVNQIFLTALGSVVPPNVLLIPILVRDKVVCIFYADQMLEEIPTNHLHYLHLLTPKVETAFENLILSAKKVKA